MLRIFIMAMIFSVGIFSSSAFAQPTISVFEIKTPQALTGADFETAAAENFMFHLMNTGKFKVYESEALQKEMNELLEELGYKASVPVEPEYRAFSQLITVPANRVNRNKLEMRYRVFLVHNNSVIWSAESSKIFSVREVTVEDLIDAVYLLSLKVIQKLVRDIDSEKLVLE